MQAVILLGGQGTRLRALYPDRPKALVPVAGRPFLAWQLAWLARGGITDIHLAAGHLAPAIAAWARRKRKQRLTVSVEPEPLGTGGGLLFAEPFLRSDPFLVINGDTLLPELDFQGLEKEAARRSNAWIVLAVAPVSSAGRYGTVVFDAEGCVTAFREKAERRRGWINGGVYLVTRRALRAIPRGRAVSLETEVFPDLAARGRLRVFRAPPPLLDMGTPRGLSRMDAFLRRTATNKL